MERNIPSTTQVMSALLRADFTTQWRNRRSFILVLIIPIIILISFKPAIQRVGGAFVLSECITLGLVAIGLMGYTNSIARDREKGIFQRLRVAPMPSWAIMGSRLTVQLAMIILLTLITYVAGQKYDQISLTPAAYALTLAMAFVGGSVYLSLGQVIVGLVKNPESVNSTTRLVYFAFIVVGMFGETGLLGEELKKIVVWSPYGTVKHMLAAGMAPETWNQDATNALLVTLGYTVVFSVIGIRKFQWNNR